MNKYLNSPKKYAKCNVMINYVYLKYKCHNTLFLRCFCKRKIMDFETLGEPIVNDSLEGNEYYVRVSDSEEFKRTGKSDLEKAKAFLSTVNPVLNISLYDHLADVLKMVLRSEIPNAVDRFEELSLEVKKLRQHPESDLTEVFEIGEELQRFVAEKQVFYKFKVPVPQAEEIIKSSDIDEADSEDEDEDEGLAEVDSAELGDVLEDLTEVLPDLHYAMSRFNEAGIGLSPVEVFEATVALKDLATQFKLQNVRFWGKVLGLRSDFYVAEAPYQDGIVQENFGWETAPAKVEEEEDLEEEEDIEPIEEEQEEGTKEKEGDDEAEEGEEVEEPVKIPPIPEPKQKTKKRIPSEKNGTGVNEYVYFVCSNFGQPWRILPFMQPSHVSEARHLKRFFTGDLELQIRGSTPYPGTEAHYLRAQIARITATTYVAPEEYFKKAGEDDDGGGEDENEDAQDSIDVVVNDEYTPRPVKQLHSDGTNGWCHYRKAVLVQGRCIPMKLDEMDEENGEEEEEKSEEDDDEKEGEEEPEITEAIVETKVPILRSISEDKALGRLKPWTFKLSSKLVEEKAVLIVCSNLWPGAYTFYDGKSFEHIYIGYGYKYSVFHFAPPIRTSWQTEYEVGDDVIEHVDEEVLPKEETEEGSGDEGKDDTDGDKTEGEEEEEDDDDDVDED